MGCNSNMHLPRDRPSSFISYIQIQFLLTYILISPKLLIWLITIHNIFLTKLHYYGIRNTPLALLQNYFTNRKQYCDLKRITSTMLSIHKGVPQGSILRPLLFILYVNDFKQIYLSIYLSNVYRWYHTYSDLRYFSRYKRH